MGKVNLTEEYRKLTEEVKTLSEEMANTDFTKSEKEIIRSKIKNMIEMAQQSLKKKETV